MSAICSSAAPAATQCASVCWETHADARSAAQPCAAWDRVLDMWVIILAIVIIIIFRSLKSGNSSEDEIAAIVEAADSGDPSAKAKLGKYFDNGLTAEKHNEIRRKVYLPKALKGDSNAQYWLGLIETSPERLEWWTKAAENGNTEAMMGLYSAYSDDGLFGLREDKEKARYWLVKAAETDPEAMVSLGLNYNMEENDVEALTLYIKAGNIGCGQIKVKAHRLAARIYGDISFAGYDSEREKEYLLKALNAKPAPKDNFFDDEYAQAASALRDWFKLKNIGSPSGRNAKNAAYCAVIAAVLDRDYADKLSEYSFSQPEFHKWAEDARNYNFKLPC